MNEIRKNKEEEVEVVSTKFAMPKIEIIVLKVLAIGFILLGVVGIFIGLISGNYGLCNFLWLSILLAAYWAIRYFGLMKSKCVVTNKTIKGVNSLLISKKFFNYRLDKIINIEMQSSILGIHTLVLNFSQGKLMQNCNVNYGSGILCMRGKNVLRISYIENHQEVYDKLSDLLSSVKNDIDIAVDIAMLKAKTEDENRSL